jgi:hypothetical protein
MFLSSINSNSSPSTGVVKPGGVKAGGLYMISVIKSVGGVPVRKVASVSGLHSPTGLKTRAFTVVTAIIGIGPVYGVPCATPPGSRGSSPLVV